jgi:hypothetical protein
MVGDVAGLKGEKGDAGPTGPPGKTNIVYCKENRNVSERTGAFCIFTVFKKVSSLFETSADSRSFGVTTLNTIISQNNNITSGNRHNIMLSVAIIV